MISPLTESGVVDVDAVGRMADYILDGGCSGLFVLGGTGEGAWLSTSQREAIVSSSVRATAGRAPVLVGLMLPGTAPVRDAAHQAADAGADGLIPGLGNVAPRVMVALVNAARERDLAACQRLHAEIFELTGMYTQKAGLPGLYAACALLGLVRNVPAEPWVPVGSADMPAIEAILRQHDLLPLAAAV